jgi:putative peptide zinc metalloprotease protein
VEIWFPVGTGLILKRKIDSVKSYSERDLRDSPFSSRFGGELATEVKGEAQKDAPLEAQYHCSVYLDNAEEGIPLGMTGRLGVFASPKSLIARLFNNLVRTFNRESFL